MIGFKRVFIEVVELDLDKCTNVYGVSLCTAGRSDTGTAQAGAATTITLRAAASAVDDTYNTEVVRITGGTGSGQERTISDYVGATKVATVSTTWDTNPDNTSTYLIIDRPGACYNTFGTCQDTPNYVKGTKTYRFCSRGAPIPPGEGMRPYIDSISSAPTEIKPEDGLAPRSSSSIKMLDEPGPDTEQDPYIRNRATSAQGTFWTRLLSRNYNYAGRFARIRRAYLTGAWSWADFTTELYIIEMIKGPTGKGDITITLKDPTKLADRIKVPTITSGKLAAVLGTSTLSLTLDSGSGTQYPATGYIRHKGQVIRYTSNVADVLSWPDTTYRSQFNTTTELGAIGDSVQLCRAWTETPFTTVLNDILNDSGIEDANIDLTGFATEETNWLGERYYVTACITEPEDGSKLIAELCQQANGVMWWSPTDQKVKFKVIGPRDPSETMENVLTDQAHLIEDSVSIQSLDNLRLTRAAINYTLATATSNRSETKNYINGELYIDADAESDVEYGDIREKTENSRWFGSNNSQAMQARVSRQIAYYRNAPKQIDFMLDPKDADIHEGELFDIETKQLTDVNGAPDTQRVLIVKRQDDGKGRIKVSARTTVFNLRYAFIAPAGHPDYLAADEDERAYAFICNSSGLMSNGDQPYIII